MKNRRVKYWGALILLAVCAISCRKPVEAVQVDEPEPETYVDPDVRMQSLAISYDDLDSDISGFNPTRKTYTITTEPGHENLTVRAKPLATGAFVQIRWQHGPYEGGMEDPLEEGAISEVPLPTPFFNTIIGITISHQKKQQHYTITVEPGFAIQGAETVTIYIDDEIQLAVQGKSVEIAAASWQTDKPLIAEVSAHGGLVRGKSEGKAVITAISRGKSASVTVDVRFKGEKSLAIDGARWVALGYGVTRQFTKTCNVPYAAITWTSDNPAVAAIDPATGAVATADQDGAATITATLDSDQTIRDSVALTVSLGATQGNTVAPVPGLSGFYTDNVGKLAYALTEGGIEIRSKPTGSATWLYTAYYAESRATRGWYYDLNGRGPVQSGKTASPKAGQYSMIGGIQRDERNGVELAITPYLIKVNDIPYVLIVHTLTNTSTVAVQNQQFGVCSDIQIDRNDVAPLQILANGNIETHGAIAGKTYKIELVCTEGDPVTPVSTKWIGRCRQTSNASHQANGDGTHFWENIYNDTPDAGYNPASGTTYIKDSTFAFSYQNIDLEPGETRIYLIRFTLVDMPN
ncbi:MAG: Ig-like domain-containing protein [Spirochaetaceae bacterium]|jgi:hypothetical protein|nr:Ig-like domain-containing protein [Spirochaetaceae bacterium]